jgi:hypothetical protein
MHFSSAAAVLALVSAATASTEGYLHDAGDQLALARAAIMYFTRDASSILSPVSNSDLSLNIQRKRMVWFLSFSVLQASIPNAIRATASRIDKAAAEAMDVKSVSDKSQTSTWQPTYADMLSSINEDHARLWDSCHRVQQGELYGM